MGTYLTFYRLHRLSFIASSLLALLVYTETGYASLAILTKVIVLAALIFLFIPSIKKNSAYFQNLGFSVRKILVCVSIIDFLVLITFIISIKFVKNYA